MPVPDDTTIIIVIFVETLIEMALVFLVVLMIRWALLIKGFYQVSKRRIGRSLRRGSEEAKDDMEMGPLLDDVKTLGV